MGEREVKEGERDRVIDEPDKDAVRERERWREELGDRHE